MVGDVATAFGAPGAGDDLTSRIGLTATTLGVALAVIRLASIGALPATSLADQFGRRRTLLVTLGAGLALTALGAAAPAFWLWVAAVALARPGLSTGNALAGVVAAEESHSSHRSWSIAVVVAAYGIGAGVVPVVRGVVSDASFRVVTALALVPLLALPLIARSLREPDVYVVAAAGSPRRWRLPGAIAASHGRRLALLLVVAGGIAVGTGPGFTYVFVYGEQVLDVSRGAMAVLVVAAGPVGLVGLLLGRWLSDHVGRRPAVALSLLGVAGGLALAYRGEPVLLFVGYLTGIAASGAFGPPIGSLGAEAFPTRVRATVAGWSAAAGVVGAVAGLAAFGILADVTAGFETAATVLAVVVGLAVLALLGLPETRGTELEEHVSMAADVP